MKRQVRMIGIGMAAAGCCALGVVAMAGDKDKDKAKQDKGQESHEAHKGGGQSQGGPDEAAMMAKWMEYATPGENHKFLENWVGNWDASTKMWQAAGAPAEESKATSVGTMMMGGRYFSEEVKGTFDMGGGEVAFEGKALMGYDNAKKKYFSLWIDNFGTGLWEEWGERSADGKSITTTGEGYDPMMGVTHKSKSVATLVDANTRRLEMYKGMPDGTMFKAMEITYKRR